MPASIGPRIITTSSSWIALDLIVADFRIEHTAHGWQHLREQFAALGPNVAACVETSQGAVVEQLLDSGVTVYPISPLSAKNYRVRKVPSGNKTDRVDAWSLADALRVDGHGWESLWEKKIRSLPSCGYCAAMRSR